jgi:hypothetical protein
MFGVWLDDATMLPQHAAWLTLSISRWLSPGASGIDAPVMDFSAAVMRRVQVSATVPYYRATDQSSSTFRGFGDLYVGSKVLLWDPGAHRVGVATAPTVEVLNTVPLDSAAGDPGRVNWVLPLCVEMDRRGYRAYGTVGYFSKGAVFVAGAFERTLTERLAVTGSLTHSRSTDDQAVSEAIGLSTQRTDASGGAMFRLSPTLNLFGSVGRTLSRMDYDSSRLALSVGMSMSLVGPVARPRGRP